jgi:hypothetical protein
LATTNSKFLVKNGLAVAGSTGAIDVINTLGQWIGATGTLSGATGVAGATGVSGATGTSGDRYLTTSSTSFTLADTGSQTVTVGTSLAYSANQTIILTYDASNHQHGRVTSYNSGTGSLVFDKYDFQGSGTYASWTVNLDGAVGAQGASGIQGASGSTGIEGASGATGIQGATGVQGASGLTGLTGATGVQGASGAGGGLSPWSIISSNTTAVSGSQYLADTSGGAFTVTLPLSPSTGDQITIADNNDFSVYNLTVSGNGETIGDSSADLVASVTGEIINLVYNSVTWKLWTNTFISRGATGAWDYSGDLNSLSGSEDLSSGSGTIDLNADSFSIQGDLMSLSGSEDLNSGTGSTDLLT